MKKTTFVSARRRARALCKYTLFLLAVCLSHSVDAQGAGDLDQTGDVRPNIVVVFIDDMGWADLSCFGGLPGQTPHIDQLAEEGLRFSQFYDNAPICSPSRCALTTGQYPARHRITSYLAERNANDRRGIAQWLSLEVPTLPRMLAEAGYRTGHFGKWHLGGQRDVGEAPLVSEYGFDATLTNFEGLGPRLLPLCDAFDGSEPRPHALGSDRLGRGPIVWMDRSLITEGFVARSIEFIDASVAQGRPFYINVWPDDVHSPFFPPADLRGEGGKRERYLGVLHAMDDQLGVLFDRIRDDPALRDNTLVLLASDNGHEPGAGRAGPLRGHKGQLYEGGVRSPLIVWGPALVDTNVVGSVNETTVLSSIDLVASLIEFVGVSPPADYEPDGEVLTEQLLGRSDAARTGPLFWRRPPDRPGPAENPFPDLAVREGRWKLVCGFDGSSVQLFDLNEDIGEQRDIAAAHPEVVGRLREAVLAWNRTLPRDAGEGPIEP